jgi:hypothetical protein
MSRSHAAKPATALHGEPASVVEQIGGPLNLENSALDPIAQPETAMAAAMRAALARRGVSQ